MWNILIVVIIALIIWMFNPLQHISLKPTPGVEKKTLNEVNQVESEAVNQVNYARQVQKQQQEQIDNQ